MEFERADQLIRAALDEGGLGTPEPRIRPSLVNSRKKWSASLNQRKSSTGNIQTLPKAAPIDLMKRIQTDRKDTGFKETPPIETPTTQNDDEKPPSPDVQQTASQTNPKNKTGKQLR